MDSKTIFAERLKEILSKRKMKQTKLCALSNTAKSSMSQYLSGRKSRNSICKLFAFKTEEQ
ncbi:MAG: helix-turn-helix transcriptional regulator [Pseudobutyrivibrio sp.]|nr:helix-turn-helix transcriptional regulator [Pseudobutyrivibrio sp.]